MGVCCLVLDIDGMLFEFFMNFLNIEKKKKLNLFSQYFMFSSHFMLNSNISRKKIWEYKTIISHLMFSSCSFCMLEILKSAPSLTATG